jgi:putative membrane protein
MKVPQMIAAELRRLVSTPMAVVALIALLCVPVLYGGLYLWANQDPYGRLSEIPVALVVDDEGADLDGAARNIGDEVAAELLDDGTFDWQRLSADGAAAALENGDVDFAIEIPADFSAAIASITGDDPHAADIVLRRNDANNYLASTIGSQAVERIRATITEKVVAEAGLTMLDALHTIRVHLTDAASGAQQLADGLGTARSGSSALQDGAAGLAEGTATLRDGAGQVAAGTADLGAVADRVADASTRVVEALPGIRDDIAARAQEAGLDPQQVADLLTAVDPLGEDVRTADERVQSAVGRIDALGAGAQAVADGAAVAADGATQLHDGASTLTDGLTRLGDGASTLQQGLADGAGQLPDSDEATRSAQSGTLGSPVEVRTSDLAGAQNYGAGLAPFFAALAGWIGIYALFLIVRPISRRAVTALHSPLRVTLAGWATPALLGGLQMIGLFAVLSLALGFSFASPVATLGLLLLASATYTAIILALNVWLGSVGQFLGLVLMVLQLVTAGGTFPWQTLPPPLAALHHVLPMGYVVDAMRQVMYGGDLDRVWVDVTVLLAWLAGAGIVAAIGVTRMTHFRTLRDLRPSLIG